MSFDTRLLTGLGALAAVVESGSFVRAAENLGMSDSGVSRAIGRLEARMGVRLLNRTTRAVGLTDEGRRFYESVAPLLIEIEGAAALASGTGEAVRGRLRVDVDAYLARRVLAYALPAFLENHPDVEVEIVTRATVGDLVGDGIDLALRFGPPPQASATTTKILETRILTVAAPAYIARHGHPPSPEDLAGHDCIAFRNPTTGRPFQWEFRRRGEVRPVSVSGRLTVADVGVMLNACMAGAGIAQVMALGIEDLLAEGRLIDLFPDWPDETFPLHAVHPSRRHVPAKVRAFLSFCRTTMP